MSVVHSKTYLDNILGWEKGIQMPTPPANLYIGLLTAMPTKNDGTSMVEVSGNGYARVQVTPAQWAAITTLGDNLTESSSNNALLSFPTPSGTGWGTVVGYVVCTDNLALSGSSNWIRAATLTGGSQAITAGETVQIPVGNVSRLAA